MYSFVAEDVNQALQFAIEHLEHEGVEEPSRVGAVVAAPGPVLVEYKNPRRRVLISPSRDANHVFHVMEFIWFMSGSNEIEFPVFFNSSYSQFSDDGRTMWDSYGWRWREFFGWDQLDGIVEELKINPTSRRCVLSMWNSTAQTQFPAPPGILDLACGSWSEDFAMATSGGKAVPCNTHAYFAIRNGKLNMTVMNRSNDLFWGMCGANAVHFSFLLEYMAVRIGVPMGSYFHFTNNLHYYTEKFNEQKVSDINYDCITAVEDPEPPELGPELEEEFDEDVKLFMPWALAVIRAEPPPETWPINTPEPAAALLASDVPPCKTAFMYSVVIPMFLFWVYRKWKDEYSSEVCLSGIDAPDWELAIREWRDRRVK